MTNVEKAKRSSKNDLLIKKISFPSGFSFLLDNDELLKVEKTDSKHLFGIAVDLGTTSICVSLCNLESGQELASAICDNQQDELAVMLLDKKKFIASAKETQKIISQTMLQLINKAVDQCIQKSGVNRDNIYTAVLIGSPIMQQIILSIPESLEQNIGRNIVQVKASIAGIKINPAANVKFIPGFNEYIGSDIMAGIMSLKIMRSKQISVCIDLGMRAKVIIGNKDKVFIGSISAASVFEGHYLKCGMVTQPGAIEWARINTEKVDILTIGHIRPQGICGSGIIDIVSEMISNKIIASNGRMENDSFIVYQDKKTKIEITQQDIKKVQGAKAAVAAAFAVMLRRIKLDVRKIKKVYIAGQLGDYLNPENLIKIGLIPAELKQQTKYAGNAAFLGAKLALLSHKNMRQIIPSADKISHIIVDEDKSFKPEFDKALPF